VAMVIVVVGREVHCLQRRVRRERRDVTHP
jgi:hypothetical protein